MILPYKDPLSILAMNIYDNIVEASERIGPNQQEYVAHEIVRALESLSFPLDDDSKASDKFIELPLVACVARDKEDKLVAVDERAGGEDGIRSELLKALCVEFDTRGLITQAFDESAPDVQSIAWSDICEKFKHPLPERLQKIGPKQDVIAIRLPPPKPRYSAMAIVLAPARYPRDLKSPIHLRDKFVQTVSDWTKSIYGDLCEVVSRRQVERRPEALEDNSDLSYVFLRQLLKKMQDELSFLAGNAFDLPSEDTVKGFEVVFVMPILRDDEKQFGERLPTHYSYVLTPRQITELKQFYDSGSAERRADRILKARRARFIETLTQLARDNDVDISYGAANWNEVEITNVLRVIHRWLNRQPKEDSRLRALAFEFLGLKENARPTAPDEGPIDVDELVKKIEGEWSVPQTATFLIDDVYNRKVPEVVEEIFINDPRAKQRIPTEMLVGGNLDESHGYPLQLHQLELLFFPDRMFMFPMVVGDIPIMLCAFDADKFRGNDRAIVKSVIDRYTDSIFLALLEFTHANSTKRLRKHLTGRWDDDQRLIKTECSHLLKLFTSRTGSVLLSAVDHTENDVGWFNKGIRGGAAPLVFNIEGYNDDICLRFHSSHLPSPDSDNSVLLSLYKGMLEDTIRTRLSELSKKRSLAVSVVNARNMSHNIGSHVLSRMAQDSLKGILGGDGNQDLADFISYLQSRMEFLSDLAIATPASFVPSKFWSEMVEPWIHQSNRILLDRISGIDQLSSEEIDFAFSGEKSTVFASPYGPLGFQAFYVILENIIRNTAKHGGEKLAQATFKVVFRIGVEVASDHPELLAVTISDSLKSAKDMGSDGKFTYSRLEEYVEEPVLGPSEELRSKGWGMLEMKIAAAYLRGVSIESLDAHHDPRLLEVGVSEEGSLEYRFYLRKPQEILIYDPEQQMDLSFEHIAKWKSKGIEFASSLGSPTRKTGTTLDSLDNPNIDQPDTASLPNEKSTCGHRILVALDESVDDVIHKKPHLPSLMVVAGVSEANELRRMLRRDPDEPSAYNDLLLFSRQLAYRSYTNGALLIIARYHQQEPRIDWRADGVPMLMIPDTYQEVHYEHGETNTLNFVEKGTNLDISLSLGSAPLIGIDRHSKLQNERGLASTYSDVVLHGRTVAFDEYAGGSLLYSVLQSMEDDNVAASKIVAFDLILSQVVPVFIVDERVHQEAHSTDTMMHLEKTNIAERLEAVNVYLPLKKCDPHLLNREQLMGLLLQMIERWKQRAKRSGLAVRKGFVVIHLTILERCFGNPEGIGGLSKELQTIEREFELVITTGRGASGIIRNTGCKYLPLTELMKFTVREPSKHHLLTTLLHTRGIR